MFDPTLAYPPYEMKSGKFFTQVSCYDCAGTPATSSLNNVDSQSIIG